MKRDKSNQYRFIAVIAAALASSAGLHAQPGPTVLPSVTVLASDPYALEGTSSGAFTLIRTGPTTNALTVNLLIRGTASNGVDYVQIPDAAIIPVGSMAVDILVQPIPDTIRRGNKTVILGVDTNSAYVGTAWQRATVTIVDDIFNIPPPTITLTSPTNGSVFGTETPVVFTADASDAGDSIQSVSFYLDNAFVGRSTNSPYTLTWTNPVSGHFVAFARAVDQSGQSTLSAPVHFSVTNEAPSVKLTSPSNGANFTAHSNISLAADASASAYTVAFLANGPHPRRRDQPQPIHAHLDECPGRPLCAPRSGHRCEGRGRVLEQGLHQRFPTINPAAQGGLPGCQRPPLNSPAPAVFQPAPDFFGVSADLPLASSALMKTCLIAIVAAVALGAGPGVTRAQGTAFTYQGWLAHGGAAANGSYDLAFSVYDAATNATPIPPALTNFATLVSNGSFVVTLDFGPGMFTGAERWLGISVRPSRTGSFTDLRPWQPLTPSPYAVMAGSASNLLGTVPAAQLAGTLPGAVLSGVYGQPLSFTNGGNHFSGNGAGLLAVNAATLNGLAASGFWMLGGNQGANPAAGNFVGTTDNQPLELRVYGRRALRLEPTTNSPNVILGSASNGLSGDIYGATIGGGGGCVIGFEAYHATIAGGTNNLVDDGAYESTISGGSGNEVQSGANDCTIAGGAANQVATGVDDATIGGGDYNQAAGPAATVSGGEFNTAEGYAATVPGGAGNVAGGDYSFAAGGGANATNTGAFVWADSSPYLFNSTNDNEFAVRATGGVRFVSGLNASGNPSSGVRLAVGGGSWSSLSDRDSKENIRAVDAGEILSRLVALPIAAWNYRSQDPVVRHLGPMAQDFAAAFGLGEDERHITTIDEEGVALAAIQGLNRKVEEKAARIQAQESRIRSQAAELIELKQRLEKLERLVNRPAEGIR